VDSVSPEARSRVMAKVRSQRNRSTEWRLRASLIRAGISGWNLNPTDVCGKPDFVFRSDRVVLFVDGCFWHGCGVCQRVPSSNTGYWDHKIARNRKRDRTVTMQLRREGWRVLRIWEHELGTLRPVVVRIEKVLVLARSGAQMPSLTAARQLGVAATASM
jgi:DNA mismatch endonuclease (patch repair protein)